MDLVLLVLLSDLFIELRTDLVPKYITNNSIFVRAHTHFTISAVAISTKTDPFQCTAALMHFVIVPFPRMAQRNLQSHEENDNKSLSN